MDYVSNPIEAAEVVASHRKEGKSNKEIAELLGITQKSGVTIVSRLQKISGLCSKVAEFAKSSGVTYQQLDRWILRRKDLGEIDLDSFKEISGLASVLNLENKSNVVQLNTVRAKCAVQAQSGPASDEYILSTNEQENDVYLKSTHHESQSGQSVQPEPEKAEKGSGAGHDEAVHVGAESVQPCTDQKKMESSNTKYGSRTDLRKMKGDVYIKSTHRRSVGDRVILFLGNPRNLHSLFHHSLALLLLVASYYAIKDIGGELAIPMQIAVDVFFLYVWMYARPGIKTYIARGIFTVFVAGSILANPLFELWDNYEKRVEVEAGVKTGAGTVTKEQRDEQIKQAQGLLSTYTNSLALVEQGTHPKQIKLDKQKSDFNAWVKEMKDSKVYLYPEKSRAGALKLKELRQNEASVAEFERKLPNLISGAQKKSEEARSLAVGEFSSQEKMDMREIFLASLKSNGLVAGLRFLVLFAVIFMAVEVSREKQT